MTPLSSDVGSPNRLRCGSIVWEKSSSGPCGSMTSRVATKPALAYSVSRNVLNHSKTSTTSLFVISKPHWPFNFLES